MAARLKTYAAEIDGLHEWIVAAPNQAAALEAFGVGQNLFAQAAARVETDPDKVKCALAHPGVPLRRLKGSSDPFGPVAANAPSGWEAALEAAARAPKAEKGKARGKASSRAAPEPLPPSRRGLDKAESALAELEEERTRALAEIEEERRALDEREAEVKARFKTRLAKARDRVKVEAAAYRRAGGA
jgi:hypothetical protein